MEAESNEGSVCELPTKKPLDPMMSVYFYILENVSREKIYKQLQTPYEIAIGLKELKSVPHKMIIKMCTNLKELLNDIGLWNSSSVRTLIQKNRIRFTICHNLFKVIILLHERRVQGTSRSLLNSKFFTFHYKRRDFPHLQIALPISSPSHSRRLPQPAEQPIVGQPEIERREAILEDISPFVNDAQGDNVNVVIAEPVLERAAPQIDRPSSLHTAESSLPVQNIDDNINVILNADEYEKPLLSVKDQATASRKRLTETPFQSDEMLKFQEKQIPVHRWSGESSSEDEEGQIIPVVADIHEVPAAFKESQPHAQISEKPHAPRPHVQSPMLTDVCDVLPTFGESEPPVQITDVQSRTQIPVHHWSVESSSNGEIAGNQIVVEAEVHEVPRAIRESDFLLRDGNETRKSGVQPILPMLRESRLRVPSVQPEEGIRSSDLLIIPEHSDMVEPPDQIIDDGLMTVPRHSRLDAVNQYLKTVESRSIDVVTPHLFAVPPSYGERRCESSSSIATQEVVMGELNEENSAVALELASIERPSEKRPIEVTSPARTEKGQIVDSHGLHQSSLHEIQVAPEIADVRRDSPEEPVRLLRDVLGFVDDAPRRRRKREKKMHISSATLKRKFNRTYDSKVLIRPSDVLEQLSKTWLDVLDVRRVTYVGETLIWQPYDFVEAQRVHDFNFLDFPEEENECEERLCEKNLRCWSFENYQPKDSKSRRIGNEADEYLLSDLRDYARSVGNLSLFTTAQNFLRSKRRSMILLEQKSKIMVDLVARLCEDHNVNVDSFRDFHLEKRRSALPLEELIRQKEEEEEQLLIDSEGHPSVRFSRQPSTTVEEFGGRRVMRERKWVERDGENTCIEYLKPVVPEIRVFPPDMEELRPVGHQKIPVPQRIIDVNEIIVEETRHVQSEIENGRQRQEISTTIAAASGGQEQPIRVVPGAAEIQLQPPLPQIESEQVRTRFFDSDEEYSQRRSRTITYSSVLNSVKSMWEILDDVLRLSELCPLQTPRGNVAKTFGRLLHLHEQNCLYLEVDKERSDAEAVLILPPKTE